MRLDYPATTGGGYANAAYWNATNDCFVETDNDTPSPGMMHLSNSADFWYRVTLFWPNWHLEARVWCGKMAVLDATVTVPA